MIAKKCQRERLVEEVFYDEDFCEVYDNQPVCEVCQLPMAKRVEQYKLLGNVFSSVFWECEYCS